MVSEFMTVMISFKDGGLTVTTETHPLIRHGWSRDDQRKTKSVLRLESTHYP